MGDEVRSDGSCRLHVFKTLTGLGEEWGYICLFINWFYRCRGINQQPYKRTYITCTKNKWIQGEGFSLKKLMK